MKKFLITFSLLLIVVLLFFNFSINLQIKYYMATDNWESALKLINKAAATTTDEQLRARMLVYREHIYAGMFKAAYAIVERVSKEPNRNDQLVYDKYRKIMDQSYAECLKEFTSLRKISDEQHKVDFLYHLSAFVVPLENQRNLTLKMADDYFRKTVVSNLFLDMELANRKEKRLLSLVYVSGVYTKDSFEQLAINF